MPIFELSIEFLIIQILDAHKKTKAEKKCLFIYVNKWIIVIYFALEFYMFNNLS